MINNIIIALISGFVGSILTSIVSLIIFLRQVNKETNRYYLKEMFNIIQSIYLNIQRNIKIDDDIVYKLIAFKVVGVKIFSKFETDIDEIQKLIVSYNDGVDKSISSTSSQQITYKKSLENKLQEIAKNLYKLT